MLGSTSLQQANRRRFAEELRTLLTMSEELKEQFWVLPLPKWDRSAKTLSVDALANKQSLEHADFTGKRVLVRVDYNVPIKNGVITDTTRIDYTLDTLRYILGPSRGTPKAVVLICHMGRPGGKFKKADFSLAPVADKLREYLADLAPVEFLPDCVGPDVVAQIDACKPGTVFLCENLRFHIEETGKGITASGQKIKANKDDITRFGDELTKLGDVLVFEAFGAAHRPHTSVVGIHLPQRVAGLLMQKEMHAFAKILGKPKRPFLAIIGGAKVTDKIPVMENLLDIVDEMIIGGGMSYTFKKVIENVQIGDSLFDEDGQEMVKTIVAKAKAKGVTLHLPVDHVIADKFSADATTKVVDDKAGIPKGWMGLDVGPASQAIFKEAMGRAKSILWNGPLGVFEWEAFSKGTGAAMEEMVAATRRGAFTIIGGGDTGAASRKFIVDGKPVAVQVSHLSTGGGSSLVLMEGKMLPGIDMLSDVADKPPEVVDVKNLWLEVRALKVCVCIGLRVWMSCQQIPVGVVVG